MILSSCRTVAVAVSAVGVFSAGERCFCPAIVGPASPKRDTGYVTFMTELLS